MLQDKLSLSKVRSMLHEYPVSPASQQRRTDTSASALAGDSAHVTIHCWKALHRLMKTCCIPQSAQASHLAGLW